MTYSGSQKFETFIIVNKDLYAHLSQISLNKIPWNWQFNVIDVPNFIPDNIQCFTIPWQMCKLIYEFNFFDYKKYRSEFWIKNDSL